MLVSATIGFLLLARHIPNVAKNKINKINVILRTDLPTNQRPANDRPLFLEEPSWKNFKRPYLHNGAR